MINFAIERYHDAERRIPFSGPFRFNEDIRVSSKTKLVMEKQENRPKLIGMSLSELQDVAIRGKMP